MMSVSFASCSDKDDDNLLVGTWVDDTYPAEVITYTFNSNGSGTGSVTSYGQVSERWSFTYTLTGDIKKGAQLIMNEYGDVDFYQVRITGGNLYMYYEDGDYMVFKHR